MTTEAFPKIRRADLADAQAVADIRNVAILSATARFDIEPKSVAEHTQWLQSRDERASSPRGRDGWQGCRLGVPYKL